VTFVVAAGVSLLFSGLGVRFEPDVTWLASGFDLWPSPLGTLAASLSLVVLASLHAVAVGLIFAGLVTHRPPFVCVLAALPVVVWLGFLGVDAIAGVLFVLAYTCGRDALYLVAGAFHFQALVLALGAFAWRRRVLAGLVVGVGLVLLLATPYRNTLAGELSPAVVGRALVMGVLVTGFALLPGAVGGVVRPLLPLAVAAGACSALVSRAEYAQGRDFEDQFWGTLRYALPVVLLGLHLAAHRADGRTERPKTAPRLVVPMRLKAFGLMVAVAALVALLVVPAAFAQTVPAIPVDEYGDSLLSSLATAIGAIFPYAAAITAFAIGVGMVKRWLGHRKATRV
jgi:hypothetical protein